MGTRPLILGYHESYEANGSDPTKEDKFLPYMVPPVDEVSGEDLDDPTAYLVSFDDEAARYLPLPTKLNLRKKRAREGRSNDEVEHFLIPSRVTVRRRSSFAEIEPEDAGIYSDSKGNISSSKMGRLDAEDDLGRPDKLLRH